MFIFFRFFFRCGPCGVYMRRLSLWLSQTEIKWVFFFFSSMRFGLFSFSLCIHISFLFTSMLILLSPTSFFFIQKSCCPSEGKRVALDTSHLVLWYVIHPQVLFCLLLHCLVLFLGVFGWHVGYVVRPRWILTCFGLLVCLLGNQAYTFFFMYSFFKQFSCWSIFLVFCLVDHWIVLLWISVGWGIIVGICLFLCREQKVFIYQLKHHRLL